MPDFCRTPLFLLFPLRLACGYFLGAAGLAKVLSGWLHSPLFAVRVGEWLRADRAPQLLKPFFTHMTHHAQIYSIVVAGGELVCGAALFVGLFARYAAFGGFILCLLPLLAAPPQGVSPLSPSQELIVCAAFLSLGLCGAGRTLGCDALLRGRVPAWLV